MKALQVVVFNFYVLKTTVIYDGEGKQIAGENCRVRLVRGKITRCISMTALRNVTYLF